MNSKNHQIIAPLLLSGAISAGLPACLCSGESQENAEPLPSYCTENTPGQPDSGPSTADSTTNAQPTAAEFFGDPCFDAKERDKYPDQVQARVALNIRVLLYDEVPLENIRQGVRRDLEALNLAFQPSGLQFYVAGFQTVLNNAVKEAFTSQPATLPSSASCSSVLNQYLNQPEEFKDSEVIRVDYVPKCDDHTDGQTATRIQLFYRHPLRDFPSDHSFNAPPGQTGHAYYLGHEMGHFYGLLHPFAFPGIGDGIEGTRDYYATCNYHPEDPQSPSHIETIARDGVCLVQCQGSCFAAPSNIMDYNFCAGLPSTFIPEQLDVMTCHIQNPNLAPGQLYRHGLNSTLPEKEIQ